jgi:hypothetical protein
MFRALLLALGILGSILSPGCVRPPLRLMDGSISRPAVANDPATAVPPVAPPARGPQSFAAREDRAIFPSSIALVPAPPVADAATAVNQLETVPAGFQDPADLAPAGPQAPPTRSPVPAPPRETPDNNATPMLDAAIERVTAVRREQRDLIEHDVTTAMPDVKARARVAPDAPAAVPASPARKAPEAVVPASPVVSSPVPGSAAATQAELPVQPAPTVVPRVEMPRMHIEPKSKPDPVPGAIPAVPPEKPEVSPPAPSAKPEPLAPLASCDQPASLGIGKLRLCRKVHGFGSFEALGESEIKAGQRFLVYCEMTGMRCEARNDSYVSRLSSKIEVTSARDGTIQWARELGPAEDVCGSRRHDFYVNYRVDLPKNLAPGAYRLRLTQTDLIAKKSTSAELPFEINP